ncbi:hypothetical protein GCM10023081_17790 [Arthrobacter ginkgonis]|uniref:Uncharacterized protein n=1 Tax=Arthrobacter ginkgonis TaxID=1630594 RepID=A0ABP7C6M3_9MICC
MSRPRPSLPAAPLPTAPRPAGAALDATLHLLDRQILDTEGVPVCTVDDLWIDLPGDGRPIPPGSAPPAVTDLLAGPVLATRLFGGHPPTDRLERIPWTDLGEVGTVLRLRTRGAGLSVRWVEHWLRDHVIARIPGGRHAPD